jgi:predicted RNase H-like HicB family nuclease
VIDYQVIYEQADDGGWGAHSPDLPGCVAVARTKPDVERLMREAIPMHIAALHDAGASAPSAQTASRSQNTKPSRSTTSPVLHATGSLKIGPA